MTSSDSSAKLARLERDVRRRAVFTAAFHRGWHSVPAALQIVVAATAAYSIAHFGFGHAIPLVAVTISISTLGFNRDARPRRVLDATIGILIGIVLSEILLFYIGRGVWQLAIVLFVTLVVARVFSVSNAFAVAAGTQSMLVLLLPVPDGGVFVRSLDGLIGGILALIVTALIPRDPRRIADRDARRLVSTLTESLDSVVRALAQADEGAAALALERLRRTQAFVDDWTQSLDSAIAIARISPFLRRHLPTLRHQSRALAGLDLAARHLRVISRRVSFLVRDGVERPQLATLLGEIGEGLATIGRGLNDPSELPTAREHLASVARQLDPSQTMPDAGVTDSIVVHLVRPLVVDLLVAAEMPVDDARALLPQV